MFYGIIIRMFNYDNQKHHTPHIHAEYQDDNAIFSIEDGKIIEGNLSNKARKLVEAWLEIHKEELMANWNLAVKGEKIFKIKPLDWGITMLKIKKIDPLNNYQLQVIFENNDERICDISNFLEKGIFTELKDTSTFRQVRNTGYSAEWPNEADLSSDTLLAIGYSK